MKANYGFIKCCARSDDLFFHFTEVRAAKAAIAVGRDVAFKVERRQAPGQRRGEDKPVAVAIRAAPKGSAVFETVEETLRKGVCVERLVFGRAGGYGARGGEKAARPARLSLRRATRKTRLCLRFRVRRFRKKGKTRKSRLIRANPRRGLWSG